MFRTSKYKLWNIFLRLPCCFIFREIFPLDQIFSILYIQYWLNYKNISREGFFIFRSFSVILLEWLLRCLWYFCSLNCWGFNVLMFFTKFTFWLWNASAGWKAWKPSLWVLSVCTLFWYTMSKPCLRGFTLGLCVCILVWYTMSRVKLERLHFVLMCLLTCLIHQE